MKNEHKILHLKFKRFGANAKEWMRKCILLLPEIEKYRIWEQKKFGSIHEYAGKLAGMSHDTVNEALRILAKISGKPELRKVVEIKGIQAIRPVATVATVETSKFWADKAMTMSKHTLEIYVQEVKKAGLFSDENRDGRLPGEAKNLKIPFRQAIENFQEGQFSASPETTHERFEEPTSLQPQVTLVMQVDTETAEQLQKLKGQGDWSELLKQLLAIREEKLENEKPQAVPTESRHIPAKIKKYVAARNNGTCAFPGCKKPAQIFHHVQRFALEKIHDPDQLYGLCKEHERIAHHGLIENEEKTPEVWKIKKEPDRNAAKFEVDKLVMKYRSHM